MATKTATKIGGVFASGLGGSGLLLSFPGTGGNVGAAYMASLVATGGTSPYTFSIASGSLPAGLSLNSSTGAISGTPSTSGSTTFAAQVVDSKGASATCACTIVIGSYPVTVHAVLLTEVGPRTAENATRQPYTTLQAIVQEAVAGPLGTILHLQLSTDNVHWADLGTYTPDRVDEDGTHTYYQTTIAIPNVAITAASMSWYARAWSANSYQDQGPGSATMGSVTVTGVGLPGASDITTVMWSGVGGLYPHNATRPDGTSYWSITFTINDATAAADSNAFFIRFVFQDLDSNKNAIGPQQTSFGGLVSVAGANQVFGPLQGNYGTDGGSYVRTGEIAYVRMWVYLSNDLSGANDAWQNSAVSTQQLIGGGAGHSDILVASTGSVTGIVPPTGLGMTNVQPNASTVRIAAGQSTSYTDSQGNVWSADAYYTGGSSASVSSSIANTADPTLYQNNRFGMSAYTIQVTPGKYALTLKFCETVFSAVGQRVFSVSINGQQMITNLDIFQSAGGQNIAFDLSFHVSAPVNVGNPSITITFTAVTNYPLICAIQITPFNVAGIASKNTQTSGIFSPSFEMEAPGSLSQSSNWGGGGGSSGPQAQSSGGNSDPNWMLLSGASCYIVQKLSATPGTPYYFQFAAKSQGNTQGLLWLLAFYDATGNVIGSPPNGTVSGTLSSWTLIYPGTFVAPAGTATVVIELSTSSSETGGWGVDDVFLQAVVQQANSAGTFASVVPNGPSTAAPGFTVYPPAGGQIQSTLNQTTLQFYVPGGYTPAAWQNLTSGSFLVLNGPTSGGHASLAELEAFNSSPYAKLTLQDYSSHQISMDPVSGITFTDGTTQTTAAGVSGRTTASGTSLPLSGTWYASPTSSRNFGVVYQNTLSQKLLVMVSVEASSTAFAMYAYTDSSSSPTTNVAIASLPSAGEYAELVFVVHPGDYYKVTGVTASSVVWTEEKL